MTQVQYQNYEEVLGKNEPKCEQMNYRDKKKLIQNIDKLETKDHLGILRIIMDSTDKKIYTVNNYGTYIDLDDLDLTVLWKISYYVNLCIENLDRERQKEEAEKMHQEQLSQLDNNLRNNHKLKLSPMKKVVKKEDTEESEESEESELSPENMMISKVDQIDSQLLDLSEFDEEEEEDDDF